MAPVPGPRKTTEIPRNVYLNSYYQKRQETTSVGKHGGKREALLIVGGDISECSHYGKQYEVSTKFFL